MLFNQISILFSFLFLILGSALSNFKIEKYFILFSTLLMSESIFMAEGGIFGLKILYLLFLSIQLIEIFLNLKSSINLYTVCIFLVMYFFSLSKNLIYDLCMASSAIVFLFMVFGKNKKNQNFEEFIKIYVNLFILFLLFFIFILCLNLSTNFSFYDNFSLRFPTYYAIALSFLLFFLFLLLSIFPFMFVDKLFKKKLFDLELVLPLSIFYYGFLSKLIWVFQILLNRLPDSFKDYFWQCGGTAFALCFSIWILKSLSKNRGWENKFISICFLNLSIILLLPFLEKGGVIVDSLQWLLLAILMPVVVWAFLNGLGQKYPISRFWYSFILWPIFVAPFGTVFFSKALLALPFYEQGFFFEYMVYLGLSQLISFWVISEFFKREKMISLEAGKLGPSS